MSLLDSITSLLRDQRSLFVDPPPEFAFEISASGIAMSRTRPPAIVQYSALAEGVLQPSPIRENITDMPAFAAAVRKLAPTSGGRRSAALILPDNAMRLAVLEFDNLPEKEEEKMALVRFRLKKTVPFEVETASVSYHVQPGNKVLVAVTPADVIRQYEQPFRDAGLHPGVVTPAVLALLELLPAHGSYLVAHQNSGALAVLVVGSGILTLARSLELSGDSPMEEIASDLYATRVYVEDQAGERPDRLYLAGFGSTSNTVSARLASELDVEVQVVPDQHPGLAGYLRSLSRSAKKVAA
jgi:type IV pilus assembly protein PilM